MGETIENTIYLECRKKNQEKKADSVDCFHGYF
jgi:hypothetical protein